jgi:hypothetical protein
VSPSPRHLAALAAAAAVTTIALATTSATAQTTTPPEQVVTPGTAAPTTGARNDANNSCFLHLKSRAREEAGDDLTVDYVLKCATPINGYTITVTRGDKREEAVSTYETEIFATKKGTGDVLPDQAFNCFGDIPGFGFSCSGYYGGAYASIPGTFDLDSQARNLRTIPGLRVTATVARWKGRPDGKGGYAKNADGSPVIDAALSGPFYASILDKKPAKARKGKGGATKAKARR